MSSGSPVLLCDSANLFVRAYCSNPAMSIVTGEHIGGVVGYLVTLKKLVYENMPKRVVIAWEGGGSPRRRALLPEYKANRRPVKLNRFYGDELPDSDENRLQQISILTNVLRHLPVCQVYVENIEGDDIISHLSTNVFRDDKKIIVSSDHDMYQLIDDRTMVYSPIRKVFVTPSDVVSATGISPRNFAVAKAICGDGSDNIPGVRGVGFKGLSKKFPELASDNEVTLECILQQCRDRSVKDKGKLLRAVIAAEEDVKRNLRLVRLDLCEMVSATQLKQIDDVVAAFKPSVNRIELTRLAIKNGFQTLDIDALVSTLRYLTVCEQ